MLKEEILKDDVLERATAIFKLLSDPTRLEIVNLLKDNTLNVNTISERINKEQSATSHQLKLLYDGNLLQKKRQGRSIYYSLADKHVTNIVEQVMTHATESSLNRKEK